jgi:hypothetical protein
VVAETEPAHSTVTWNGVTTSVDFR